MKFVVFGKKIRYSRSWKKPEKKTTVAC
jgi:hypothetical protein